ncbi:MAG: O-antigen ligase domain-containing protein, partial [Pedobacter sp.]
MRIFLLYVLIIYCFTFGILGREIGGMPFGTLIEGIMLVLWIVVLVTTPKDDWKAVNSDLFFVFLFWFLVSIVEVVNPGSSTRGWLQEIRSAALYPFLMIPLGFLIFKENKHLDTFLIIVVAFSTLASLNGIK